MITYQILKLFSLFCLLIHRGNRFLSCVVSLEWMARNSCLCMEHFLPPSFNGMYWYVGCCPSPWTSIEGGCTWSMLNNVYLRTLPPPWLLCFAWKPKVCTIQQRCVLFQWWVMVLSRLEWWLSPSVMDSFNLCSSNPIALSLEFWNSLKLVIGVRYYHLSNNYVINSSILNPHFNDYINHKLRCKLYKSLSCFPLLSNLRIVICLCNLNFYTFCFQLVVLMAPKEKNKQKKSFKNTLLNRSDPVSSSEFNNDDSVIKPKISSFLEEEQQTGNVSFQSTKAEASKNLEKGESSRPQKKMDVASFLNKLSKVKENFQCMLDSSLFGFLIGKHHDFKKKTNKLKYDWKILKGFVDFIDRQAGWFEVRFSNPIDKKQIWGGRPYHLFSQLLLLKPWTPTFDPVTESIFLVDMWVRIPSFPPEYYNFESINTILDFNNVGKLLKLDPNAPKRSWAKFARFCINLDCSQANNKEIVIPNEKGDMKKFNLWFEDIPQGCGYCGAVDHNFSSCPLRKFIPPKFKITFKKPSSGACHSHASDAEESGWETVEKKGKDKADGPSLKKDNKGKQLEDFGGIGVIYITDNSSNESQTGSGNLETDLNPAIGNPEGFMLAGFKREIEKEAVFQGDGSTDRIDPNSFMLPSTIEQEDIIANQHYFEEANKEKELAAAHANLFYYQEDANENWEDGQGDFLQQDIPFEEEAIVDKLKFNSFPEISMEENSFQSLHSDNSMLKHLAEMDLKRMGQSTFGSGKRKNAGGVRDTASSSMVEAKKSKIGF